MAIGFFIIGIILWGMLIGGAAQWILGVNKASNINWTMAIVAGLVGSFVGGMLISLISGEGLEFRPSGIIGSLVGAFIVTGIWVWVDRSRAAK
ncbi:MAG: GlsB/YeaQ/YmgE family stress response membrane protein [Gordonia sp. (in: high G+C Gram-positive bacteria)]